jgi:voltage-gated potassium channel
VIVKSSVLFLGLRRMRGPLILIIAVFATGIAGLVLIPGLDAEGNAWHLTFPQALYFMSYTATTIGFGEIPAEFTDTQRLWVTAMIFASVVGWAVLVASLIALLRDEGFRGALTEAHFARSIRRLREPFHLVCGFGETGYLVGRALDRLGHRFVVLDIDPARIQELALLDFTQDVAGLTADARLPEKLLDAGLKKPECAGVLALTNDDQANLAVAMAVRLLNPRTPVVARAMSHEVVANMHSFGTDHVLNPFARFGGYLALTLAAPATDRLLTWLRAPVGEALEPPPAPPRGHWVVCGYGRFGREVVATLRTQGLDVSVIDPGDRPVPGLHTIRGLGTEAEPLIAAGIRESVGIVAGTDDDVTNLSIAVTARELNESLFTVVRQNVQASRSLFKAFAADITMVSSEIIAHDCLALIRTPRLAWFIEHVRGQDDAWAAVTLERLHAAAGVTSPDLWTIAVTERGAPALARLVRTGAGAAMLGDTLRDPTDRDAALPAAALCLTRGSTSIALPETSVRLVPGDDILFAGTPAARTVQQRMLRNLNVCEYVVNGIDRPAGWVWRVLSPARARTH